MEQKLDTDILEMLQKWSGLSDAQRRAFKALTHEVDVASELIETSTHKLSSQFQELATHASAQSKQLLEILSHANSVVINGEETSLPDTIGILETTLDDMIGNVMHISKNGVSLSYALDDLVSNVDSVKSCVGEIAAITKQTTYLALNAKIEATKAGEAGLGFSIVADEVKELSKSIQQISDKIGTQMIAVSEGVEKGRGTLREVTTVDMSGTMLAKDHIESLLRAILEQNTNFNLAIEETSESAKAITSGVSGMVTNMQFQDRTTQRLDHIKDSLEIMGNMLIKMDTETQPMISDLDHSDVNNMLLEEMIDGFHLAEVKERFIKAAMRGESVEDIDVDMDVAHSEASDDIDLF